MKFSNVIPAEAGIQESMNSYYIYILASSRNGTLYTGVTNDLMRRIQEHKDALKKSFTSKYKIFNLVYYEEIDDASEAISREKSIKKWRRKWKLQLIESINPKWQDLYNTIKECKF